MQHLQSLSLQSCVRLTNGSLAAVTELMNLRNLNIRGCLQVRQAYAKHFSAAFAEFYLQP